MIEVELPDGRVVEFPDGTRTLRVEVRSYCHIRSVTWTQP